MMRSLASRWRIGSWRRAGFVLLLLAGRRSVRLGLAGIIIGISLWQLLVPVWQELTASASLPPDVAETSLQLYVEALRSITAMRLERMEHPPSSYSQFSHLFVRALH